MILQTKLALGTIALIATGILPSTQSPETPSPSDMAQQTTELGAQFRIQTEVYFVSNPATVAAIEAVADTDGRNARVMEILGTEGSGARRLMHNDSPCTLNTSIDTSGISETPIIENLDDRKGNTKRRIIGISALKSQALISVKRHALSTYSVQYSISVQQAELSPGNGRGDRKEHRLEFSTRLARGSSMVQHSTPQDAQGTVVVLTRIQ